MLALVYKDEQSAITCIACVIVATRNDSHEVTSHSHRLCIVSSVACCIQEPFHSVLALTCLFAAMCQPVSKWSAALENRFCICSRQNVLLFCFMRYHHHAQCMRSRPAACAVHVSLGYAGCISVLRALAYTSGHWLVLSRPDAFGIDLVRALRQGSTR